LSELPPAAEVRCAGLLHSDGEIEENPMSTWAEFAASAPELAAFGQRRMYRRICYLATIRSNNTPRVHPVSPFIGGERLLIYMEPTSPKATDLRRNNSYALHCGVEDNEGGAGEFAIRGTAEEIVDQSIRAVAFQAASNAGMTPRERYVLFELKVLDAMSTVYDDDMPRRVKWKAK